MITVTISRNDKICSRLTGPADKMCALFSGIAIDHEAQHPQGLVTSCEEHALFPLNLWYGPSAEVKFTAKSEIIFSALEGATTKARPGDMVCISRTPRAWATFNQTEERVGAMVQDTNDVIRRSPKEVESWVRHLDGVTVFPWRHDEPVNPFDEWAPSPVKITRKPSRLLVLLRRFKRG
jgi:hypothetical protein